MTLGVIIPFFVRPSAIERLRGATPTLPFPARVPRGEGEGLCQRQCPHGGPQIGAAVWAMSGLVEVGERVLDARIDGHDPAERSHL